MDERASAPGRVLRDASGVRLELVGEWDVPVAQVWAALTAPSLTARWFGTWTGDPATGTVLLRTAEDPDGGEQPVVVRECVPPTRLAVDLPSPDGTWPLSVDLTEQGGRTRLVLTHRLAEPYDASSIGPGWQYYRDRLGAVVTGTRVPDDWGAYEGLGAAYAVPRGQEQEQT